jgi:hypothetical protein
VRLTLEPGLDTIALEGRVPTELVALAVELAQPEGIAFDGGAPPR